MGIVLGKFRFDFCSRLESDSTSSSREGDLATLSFCRCVLDKVTLDLARRLVKKKR